MTTQLGHPTPAPRVKAPKPLKRTAIVRRADAKRSRKLTGKYLSREWRSLRGKVMRRDKGVCQACRSAPATEVHHAAGYARGRGVKSLIVPIEGLVAVCRRCHADAHPWMKEGV